MATHIGQLDLVSDDRKVIVMYIIRGTNILKNN